MDKVDIVAVELWQSAEVAAARKEMEALYAADPNAASPEAKARIPTAVAEYAFAASLAAADDPWRPQFIWYNAWQRSCGALKVPAGRFGTDNPDNAYRWLNIAPGLSYRIEGKLAAHPPVAYTFSLISGNFVETAQIKTVGILTNRDLLVDDEGCFTITIGPEPAAGRTNHIQGTDEARMLAVRETMGDWGRELPATLTITRTDSLPTPPPESRRTLAERAAAILRKGAPNWALKFQHDSYEKLPYNQPQPIISSAKRLGGLVTQSSSHGRFKLAEDEALVIRVDPFDADYLGFQLADVWMVSQEYVDKLGCLNNFQAKRDADGRYTYVIARIDPGVYNWLDAAGLDTGGTTIRYQGLKNPDLDHSGAFETQLVKIADLRSVLSAETVWVNAAQRAEQIARRVADYQRREGALNR